MKKWIVLTLLVLFLPLFQGEIEGKRARSLDPCLARLKGSTASLARQNEIADRHGLTRIKNLASLRGFIKKGILVPLFENEPAYELAVEKHLRYARPWTKAFLEYFSQEHFRIFGKPFKITSIVRTEAYQRSLVLQGISDADGRVHYRQSSHLTGAAFDISVLPMSQKEISWTCERLREWEKKGMVEAVYEPNNNHFHIMVFPNFLNTKNPRRSARIFLFYYSL